MRRRLRFYLPAFLALLLLVPIGFLYWGQVTERATATDRRAFRVLETEGVQLARVMEGIRASVQSAPDACPAAATCDFPKYIQNRFPVLDRAEAATPPALVSS